MTLHQKLQQHLTTLLPSYHLLPCLVHPKANHYLQWPKVSLAIIMASLRCFCCCNTNCYATIKPFLSPGINWPNWFSSTGPEIPTTQCILFCLMMTSSVSRTWRAERSPALAKLWLRYHRSLIVRLADFSDFWGDGSQGLACLASIPASCLHIMTGSRVVMILMKELDVFLFWYVSAALREGIGWWTDL